MRTVMDLMPETGDGRRHEVAPVLVARSAGVHRDLEIVEHDLIAVGRLAIGTGVAAGTFRVLYLDQIDVLELGAVFGEVDLCRGLAEVDRDRARLAAVCPCVDGDGLARIPGRSEDATLQVE